MSHAITLDTLAFNKKLEASGIESKQSEAITTAVSEVFETSLNEVATKTDLALLETKLETKIDKTSSETDVKLSKLKSEIIIWIVGVVFAQTAILSIIKFVH